MKHLINITAVYLMLYLNNINAFESFRAAKMELLLDIKNNNSKILGGPLHECYRTCKKDVNKVCKYSFTVTKYTAMSIACQECPFRIKDCYNHGCITAGGYIRSVITANLMVPGPSIEVCEGDTIEVEIINLTESESITIHWHGLQQRNTPFMDGTPYVTQCPILPYNKFVYKFKANPAGTHIWHSHVGFQETDGLFGNLIVRKAEDKLSKFYDFDISEHVMIIWHWYPYESGSILRPALHRNSSVSGNNLLINGLASKVKYQKNDTVHTTPKAQFFVEYGYRYRFRIIFNSAIYCPVQVSIDNHTLLIISSDGGEFEPVEVDSLIINGGETYDFVLKANKRIDSYWIRVRGLGDCEKVKVFEEGVLIYKSAKSNFPKDETSYEKTIRKGVLLNPVQSITHCDENTTIKIVDLNNTQIIKNISWAPDHIFYFTFAFNSYDKFYAPGPYPQINDVSFEHPSFPFLTQREEITNDMFCTETNDTSKSCIGGFCSCPYVYGVKKDSLVEIVFIDAALNRDQDHPMHLHGHDFYVVAMETVGRNISSSNIRLLNERGLIKKKFKNAPKKYTIGVPSNGYAILRFRANNPGYWMFHCHVANHLLMGMSVLIKVGENHEMVETPPNFPKCGNWKPNW